jgi:transcriptional regulator with XRE-family HTH domain
MPKIYTGPIDRLVSGSDETSRMDDQRVGSGLRAVRIRRRLRQRDVASAAGVPRGVLTLIEHGRLDDVSFGQIRSVAKVLGVRFEGLMRWQGGDLDRLINSGHAQMHEAMARWFADLDGWVAIPEVSFAHFGERGVVDIVAWHATSRIVLIVELKTSIVDVNNLMSSMDVRSRRAWQIARDHGWEPTAVAMWVVVAPGRSNARILADHSTVMRAKFPADGRSMRRWLSRPSGGLAALSFLPGARLGGLGPDRRSRRRVSLRSPSVKSPTTSSDGRPEPRIGVAFRD